MESRQDGKLTFEELAFENLTRVNLSSEPLRARAVALLGFELVAATAEATDCVRAVLEHGDRPDDLQYALADLVLCIDLLAQRTGADYVSALVFRLQEMRDAR